MQEPEFYSRYFDVNVLSALHLFDKQLSQHDLLCLKHSTQDELADLAIRQIVDRINDAWIDLQFSQLVSVFRLRLNMLLLMFNKGMRVYTFVGEAELLNFLFSLPIEWLLGDKRAYINKAFIASNEIILNDEIELQLINGLFIKCFSIQNFKEMPLSEAFLASKSQHVNF